jgi:hypothetical protein
LAGVAVLQTVEEFWEHGGLFVRDAILDMSGPAARYSPFSRTINVVVGCDFQPATAHSRARPADGRRPRRATPDARHAAIERDQTTPTKVNRGRS